MLAAALSHPRVKKFIRQCFHHLKIGFNDLSINAVLRNEDSQSVVEDTGSIQDSRINGNFVDSTEPGVNRVEQDPVATDLQSQTDSKETMESGTVDEIAR